MFSRCATPTAVRLCRATAGVHARQSTALLRLPTPLWRSTLTTTAATTTTTMDKPRPAYAAGSDVVQLDAALAPLLTSSSGGRWTLTADGGGLERSFKFKTFAKTWDFMTAVSLQCKIENHHPEWSNVYNTTYIRWTTHNPRGLSAQDIKLAAKCDDLARQFGEQQQEPSPATCSLRDLASTAAASSGDCCGPKK